MKKHSKHIAIAALSLTVALPHGLAKAEDNASETAATLRKAECIRTSGKRYLGASGDRYLKIIAVGGSNEDGSKWLVDQQTLIAQTEAGTHSYVVNIDRKRGQVQLNLGDAPISLIQIPLKDGSTLETLGHLGIGITMGNAGNISRNWLQTKRRCSYIYDQAKPEVPERTPAPIVPDYLDL